MKWFTAGKIEVGVSPGRLIVAAGRRVYRILIDWTW